VFDSSNCNDCGTCFVQCPYVDYTQDKAVQEIRALKQGLPADILTACITCMACNEYCPNDARPFDLICSLQDRHNIRLVSQERISKIDQMLSAVPDTIMGGDPDTPALSLCVMGHAYPPGMAASGMFAGLTKMSCGTYYSRIVHLHMGGESILRSHAQQFIDSLAKLQKAEIVFAHDDCYVLAAKKAPEYGIPVPFRPVHIAEYMLSFFENSGNGTKKLNRKIAFQRPCIGRIIPECDRWIDALFFLTGITRIERDYDRSSALCCGIGLAEQKPEMSAGLVQKNIDDAKKHGAEAMVFSCPSCYWFMKDRCTGAGLKPLFITDIGRLALRECAW